MTKQEPIPDEYYGQWQIIETSRWNKKDLNILGKALISFTGNYGKLRMCVLLANIKCWPTKQGVSFSWEGAWEFDKMSGSGRAKLSKDGLLKGIIKIKGDSDSSFVAERTTGPLESIPAPPSYRDKWRGRW
ncbi:MAG: hypothetical protein A2504_09835 [Bdellovibrionales bacterium RIFOXYD12_FULL_39_22]|nr:MAG: hypothetical protein A2385_12860 [Bdellovibrionales bacterium RIFOXYB1_FULL_39_21]OFZ43777.1 MAG: hypothetical protein A2485_04675 [Bdellovibrionales bacterium RIFOXYC12_FULL_39_17]OFZ47677.1 MAG: hypothetical protein A2404_09630 [Bdellovibrionales bacterium RIFOXYC1_FULL_39_130]OFZ76459.1 MAG: hypothetical protein A2560_17740 [Bdellovibrionales bacterium RIFOXYD1_FULL_39_84]OFZ95126.1 MAG: hypothetical protein A2504_09835 [Bdellovibrionales bacterium RIFOXYD12_FULL_39_22]HLE11339.1 hy